jgi:acyl carrier protein
MTREDILRELTAVAKEHLSFQGSLEYDAVLDSVLELDSLRLLTLLAEVENRFRIRLEPEEEVGLTRVSDLVALIERKLQGTSGCSPTGSGAGKLTEAGSKVSHEIERTRDDL